MFPTGGSNPEAAAERRRQERLEQMDLENNPGVKALREWGEAQKEQRRLEQQQREEAAKEYLQDRAQEELRGVEQPMREQYVAGGGTALGWERAWPGIREDLLQQRAKTTPDHYSAVRSAF